MNPENQQIKELVKDKRESHHKEPFSSGLTGGIWNVQDLRNKSPASGGHLKNHNFGKSSGRSTPRRSSSRSIKRKKFDDELVESSLKNAGKALGLPEAIEIKEKEKKPINKSSSISNHAPSVHKKQKKNKSNTTPLKNVGRWRPSDDLTLITAVLQTNDLNAVHVGCKFSCRFTLNEVEDRWFALLYDPVASRLASYGMKQLPCDIVQQIQSNTLWSKEEEDLLAKTSATTTASVQYFQKLLEDNTATFHQYRTAKSVMQHWLQMKHYQLLDDQTVLALGSATATFSDFEEQVKDSELSMNDEVLEHELNISDRRAKREIRQLEEEIPRWQAIVDSLNESGTAPTEFDSQTLAVLRGRLVRYLMRSREIIVGRSTKDHNVDVDLSLEGPAGKVSRKQAVIRLKTDGEYYIMNEGRRPIFIDGKPVLTDIKAKLHHNSTFEICGLHFVFLINKDYSSERKHVENT